MIVYPHHPHWDNSLSKMDFMNYDLESIFWLEIYFNLRIALMKCRVLLLTHLFIHVSRDWMCKSKLISYLLFFSIIEKYKNFHEVSAHFWISILHLKGNLNNNHVFRCDFYTKITLKSVLCGQKVWDIVFHILKAIYSGKIQYLKLIVH